MAKKTLAAEPRADGHPYVVKVARLLRLRGQTVSFAESCTGGLLSAIFTRLPGVSDVFQGSIVAYAYPVKENLLNVPVSMLRSMGAVSLPVARKMAEGLHKRLHTSWALSITGIAGPGGGSPQKPVGTVCFGIVGPGVDEVVQRHFSGNRREIQLKSALFALRLLLKYLGEEVRAERGAGVLGKDKSPNGQREVRKKMRKKD